ncbi:hypothetical protein Aduo_000370 [Ancylostoma duodenale]
MEMLIDKTIGECNVDTAIPPAVQPDPYAVAKEMVPITGSEKCNASTLAIDTLKKWWKDGAAKQKIDRKVVTIDSFTQMAYAKTDGFACSYRRCGRNFFLVCFYNKTPVKNRVLYVLAKAQACDKCEKYPDNTGTRVECEASLCQYPLTPAKVDFEVCGAGNQCPGDFSDEFRITALDMHNYYRRLAATGWAKTGDKYADTAAKMVELQYDKDLETKANNYVTAANCPTAEEAGPAGENFFKTSKFTMSHVEAIQQAMAYWWEPFEKSGFGDQPIYTDKIQGDNLKYAANILHDQTTKLGCAVKTCNKEGRLVIDCRYDIPVQLDDAIYTTGKVCSKCKDTATTECSKLGSLCVAQP